jgi:Organic solute transporter Ostalpha
MAGTENGSPGEYQTFSPATMSFMRLSSVSNSSMQAVDENNEGMEDPLLDDDMGSSILPFAVRNRSSEHGSIRRLMRRMGNYLAYFTLLTMLIVIPIVLYRALTDRKLDLAAYNSAGVMVCGTVIMSLRLVYLHLTHWYMPQVQKYVVRILWMVPLYAIQSWLSLLFHESRIYIDTIRDFYEAFVIASFVYYLMELLGGQDALVQILAQKPASLGQHSFPLSLILNPWEMGLEFMLQCKHGVLQYVAFKIVYTVLTYLFESMGVYGEGQFEWRYAYPYLCFLQNISVMYALYSLVMLFHAVNEELRYPVDWQPLGKFLCVKGVVFFTWWQGVIIFYLKDHGIIESLGSWSSEDVAYGLIDYCVVIEMVGFAIAHSYTFTYQEYLPGNIPSPSQVFLPEINDDGDDSGDQEDSEGDSEQRNRGPYIPPATLDQPMNFKKALWSSTVPKETIKDIQQLRAGVDGVMSETKPPSSISLQEMRSSSKEDVLQGGMSDVV